MSNLYVDKVNNTYIKLCELAQTYPSGNTYNYKTNTYYTPTGTGVSIGDIPTITTTAISEITRKTAKSGGVITADGNSAITCKGILWSICPPDGISCGCTMDGTGSATFTSSVVGLSANSCYIITAYAANIIGIAYGTPQLEFKTCPVIPPIITIKPITSISYTTATGGGNVTDDGGAAVTVRGVYLKRSDDVGPTITTTDGTGTGEFTSLITGLESGYEYNIKAYAVNSAGTGYDTSSPITKFTTRAHIPPHIITSVITTQTFANVTSNITDSGDGTLIASRGVAYRIDGSPTWTFTYFTCNTIGIHTDTVTPLTPATTYQFMPFAANEYITGYGNVVTCATKSLSPPVVHITTPYSISCFTATSGGYIEDTGGSPITSVGVGIAPFGSPLQWCTSTLIGVGFTNYLTGLADGTNYCIVAYATNALGTSYDPAVSSPATFTTACYYPPTVTTDYVTPYRTGVCVRNTVTDVGSSALTSRGIGWYDPDNNYNYCNFTPYTATVHVADIISSLTPATTYCFQAFAANGLKTGYGGVITCATLGYTVPIVTISSILSVGYTTASLAGRISDDGGCTLNCAGTCWAGGQTKDSCPDNRFTSNITGLAEGTTYSLCAYATNNVGTGYSVPQNITTLIYYPPTVTTGTVSPSRLYVYACGTVTSEGTSSLTCMGIRWKPSSSGSYTEKCFLPPAVRLYMVLIDGLTPSTSYDFQAFAKNAQKISYGGVVTQSTLGVIGPEVRTCAATNITFTTADTGGMIISTGGAPICQRGVQWWCGAYQCYNYTSEGAGDTDFTTTIGWFPNLPALEQNTEYKIQAYAQNCVETCYGDILCFTTCNF